MLKRRSVLYERFPCLRIRADNGLSAVANHGRPQKERILEDLLLGVVLGVRQAFLSESSSLGVDQHVTANGLADRAKLAGAYALLSEVDELVCDTALLEKAFGLSRIA